MQHSKLHHTFQQRRQIDGGMHAHHISAFYPNQFSYLFNTSTILSNSSQSVIKKKKLLTPHADLLIVARLECEFVECKHLDTNLSWLNYSHCGWMPHQITNLI